MDTQTVFAILFLLAMLIFLVINRKNIILQKILFPVFYFILYKTTWGIKLMDFLGRKHPKTVTRLAVAGIYIGFAGMALICFELVSQLVKALLQPQAQAAVALVLPFDTGLKGTIAVPFFYWIISIFIIAVVHEFSHGIVARAYNIKLKSSGFAFLSILIPVIPAAFVEPDEKQMGKRPIKQQLGVLAAGPFSNLILALLCFAILAGIFAPSVGNMVDYNGVKISELTKAEAEGIVYPAEKAGISAGEIIQEIDGMPVLSLANFTAVMDTKLPREIIFVKTDKGDYTVTLIARPDNETKAYMGIGAEQSIKVKPYWDSNFKWLYPVLGWLSGLFMWLFILNLGIGLFNLVPIGPVDGGRMIGIALIAWLGEKNGKKAWGIISFAFLGIILGLLLLAFFG